MIRKLKRKWFPRGVRRDTQKHVARLFQRTGTKKLADVFRQLDIPAEAVVCVHSMLSGLGYLADGPGSIVRALQRAVPEVTIMMPTFPFDGTMDDYLSTDPVYDAEDFPSRSGLLTEIFRRMPKTIRSLHPTHPSAALGPRAGELITGSEHARSPFGDDSSYGRLSELDDAYLLLIHTNSSSIVHRVQEMVDMPNLFKNKQVKAKGYTKDRKINTYEVLAHVAMIPLYIVVPGNSRGMVDYMWLPDYTMLFPEYNRKRILEKFDGSPIVQRMIERHDRLLHEGIYRVAMVRDAEIFAVELKSWLKSACEEVLWSLEKYPAYYERNSMKKALEAGLLTKEIRN